MVILQPVTFRNKRDFNAHRLLRAIANNTLLSKLPKTEEAKLEDIFYSEDYLKEVFSDFPLIIENTYNLLQSCHIDFDFGNENGHNNLHHYTGNEELDFKLIKHLALKNLAYRFNNPNDSNIIDRINMELDVIKKKRFVSYFLIAWKSPNMHVAKVTFM